VSHASVTVMQDTDVSAHMMTSWSIADEKNQSNPQAPKDIG